MPLRFNTLKYIVFSCSLRKILSILLLLNSPVFFAQSNIEDVKKEANKLFEDEEFTAAYKLYSQLVSNYPKDPVFNFRLGVCMIYSEPDKKKCLTYLQQASKNPDAPKETKFYLGKAYHVNYQFNEAIKFYNDFKKESSASMQKKLQVDREIQACNNGKRLLSNLSDLVVISKKTLNEADYFRSYDLKDIGGKLLVKPEDDGWRTAADKKKKEKSVIYKSATSDRIYFSSYGPNTDNGRDIYYRDKLPNGEFTPPKKVNGINTEFDEDYPFLHPNGKTLYFASKGHNSMGGYDIFKSTYNEESDSWSKPVNLEFPINSPDDDFLFVTDSLEKTAFFSTGRQSLPGKIDVLRINTERKPIDLLALKGTVVKESETQSLKSKITVKNTANGQVIGFYDAQDNGDYFMDLPNGGKLEYTVETPGLETQSQKVDIPLLAASKPLKQTISYEKGKLKIINYFDEAASDDAYLQYMRLIEQKARLNVNVGENKLPELISMSDPENRNPQNIKGTGNTNDGNERPTLIEDTLVKKNSVTNTKTGNSNQGLNNNQLADLAKQDAEESRKEAIQMKQDAADATELGNKQVADGDSKIKQAEEAIRNAETVSDDNEKKIALDNANNLKKEGEAEKNNGTKILEYSKALESDAKNKEIITDLNNQYVKEIESIISGKNKNPDAAAKLESLQKEIAEKSAQKSQSEAIYNEIKNNTEEKEKQVNRLEQDNTADKAALQDIRNDISTTETELANTRKKKDKEPIQAKLNDLKTEQAEKEKKIAANEEEIKKQKDDLAVSKGELDLANKVKNETIAAPINTASIAQNTSGTGTNSAVENNNNRNNQGTANRITNQSLQEKYAGKIAPADNNNKASIEESNTQLKNYNREIDQAIAKDKADLAKAKSQQQKNEISNEIKQLEDQKRQNQQQVASNNKQIESLNKAVATNNSNSNLPKSNSAGLEPIATSNKDEAIKQLSTLDTKLSSNDNNNFEYNGYQNPQSQNLKIEADAKINEAALQQKKLKELIAGATDQVRNAAPGNTNTPQAASATDLFKESEDLMSKAFDLRAQANSKTGAEKDDLLAKAKEAEDLASEKHLQASEVLKNDNKNISETNLQNYETLKKENKATEMDLNEAKRLFDEASVLQKQAANIREEASSMTSVGAKLGNISNAEEKEAEALNKQEQAMFIMKKSSPATVLKKPVTSASGSTVAAVTPTVDLSNQLQEVNKAIADLANTKLEAYQKLYEANKIELDQLNATVKGKQTTIDKTPALKTEFIAAGNKISKSENLKKNSDNGTDNNAKLSDLVEATKAQTEALSQLATLDKKIGQPVATNQGENKGNEVATNNGNNAGENKGTNENAGENKGNDVTTNNGNNAGENKGTNGNAGENKGNDVATNNGNNAGENRGTNGNAGETKVNDAATNNGNNAGENKGTNGDAGENKGNEVATNNGNNAGENKGTNGNAGENKGNEVATNNGNNAGENKGANGNASENKGNDVVANNGNNAGGNKGNDVATNNNQNPAADTKTVDVQETSKKDTTAKEVLAYLDNNRTELKNPGANQQLKNTVAVLKQIEDEQRKLDEQSKNSGGTGEPVSQLKAASEKLMVEAEDLSVKSFDLKTLANSKSGQEKDSLLTASKNMEDQALGKKVEAVKINEKANKASYENNNGAITELLTKLKTDNPDLATQLEQKNSEVATLKGQADQIRSEASTLTNNNAMLGSMMNAEEKEDELLKKQNDIIAELKKQYPTYQMKEASVSGGAPVASEEVKKKQSDLNEKKFAALTDLTNSYSLEYETSKNNVPENLNEGQKAVKQNADDLNAESKKLLIKASQTNDEKEKEKLLLMAVKTGNASIEQLNKLVGGAPVARNNNSAGNNNRNNAGNNGNNNRNNAGNNNRNNAGNNANNNRNNAGNPVANNNPRNNNRNNAGNNAGNNNTGNPAVNNNANAGNNNPGRATVNIEGLQVTGNNAYNANKPIPIDAPVGNGLVFRVQIGAFKTVLPNNTFKGLNPVNGENAANGYIRYTAGNFNKFENANAVKNDLQKLGYSDAFVVVYFNGKRITLREAMDILAREGKTIDQNPNSSAGITANANIPRANALPPNVNQLEPAVITKELEQVNGLLFTVQIGVYNKQATKRQLQNLKPIFTEKLPTGLYRYTAGIYSNPEKLISDKNKVVALGIRDAFVSAYLNGRKVPFAEGKAKLQDSTTKLEPENPIVFPEGGAVNNNPPVVPNVNNNNNNNAQPNNNAVQPFTNNVQGYPAATPENGIKATQDGVCFKVQIGAYSKQVPNDVAARFNAIRNWPIENKQVNNLYIYSVGNFVGAKYAKNLLQEAKTAGITDAFITVYRDGRKLTGAEATQLLSQQ